VILRTTVSPFTSRYRSARRGRPWRTSSGFDVRVEAGPAVYVFTVGEAMDADDLTNGHRLEYAGVEYSTRSDPPAEVLDAARAGLRASASSTPSSAPTSGAPHAHAPIDVGALGYPAAWRERAQAEPKPERVPFYGGEKCYACDAKPVGLADRRHDAEGAYMPACERHRNLTIRTYDACIYCNGQVRKGSLSIDGEFAHKSCHAEASR
jgi:hypothetical protein